MFNEGYISDYDFKTQTITVVSPLSFKDYEDLKTREVTSCLLKFDDSRTISADQRKKIYATFNDIARYTGHLPNEIKELMKYYFIAKNGCKYFSLSDVDMTTAKEFLEYLIEFCIAWNVPCKDSLLDRCPDIARYVYTCLKYKHCAICGGAINDVTHLHHVDHVGTRGNRNEISHLGLRALPLCAIHHKEAHDIGQAEFDKKYHIFGIPITAEIAKVYKLKI